MTKNKRKSKSNDRSSSSPDSTHSSSALLDLPPETSPASAQPSSETAVRPTEVHKPKQHEKSKSDSPQSPTVLLVDQPSKWKNWWTRAVMSLIMVSGFLALICAGPIYVILLVIVIQANVYREVISIAYSYTKSSNRVPWFRLQNWILLFATNYYLYGESLIQYRSATFDKVLRPLATYHRFISFMLYCAGFVIFVINLKPDYKYHLSMFAWTHMTLLLVIFTSHYTINNILEGLFWFVVPCSLVIFNDVAAYIFGFFFGRTQLIRLSPKKTWEGFMGALITTPIFGFFLTGFVAQFAYMSCPLQPLTLNALSNIECQQNLVFVPHEYKLAPFMVSILKRLLWREIKTVSILPIQFHALSLSLFASIIAPFGGFFASGVKRAFKIKDYGALIPGHGGVTDRMDCQFLMGLFSYMYFQSFIGSTGIDIGQLYLTIEHLTGPQQLELYQRLQDALSRQGLLSA